MWRRVSLEEAVQLAPTTRFFNSLNALTGHFHACSRHAQLFGGLSRMLGHAALTDQSAEPQPEIRQFGLETRYWRFHEASMVKSLPAARAVKPVHHHCGRLRASSFGNVCAVSDVGANRSDLAGHCFEFAYAEPPQFPTRLAQDQQSRSGRQPVTDFPAKCFLTVSKTVYAYPPSLSKPTEGTRR